VLYSKFCKGKKKRLSLLKKSVRESQIPKNGKDNLR